MVVSADLPILDTTYCPAIRKFETETPGKERIFLHHHFSQAAEIPSRHQQRIYHSPPWEISRDGTGFTYLHFGPGPSSQIPILTATFSPDHTRGSIYHSNPTAFLEGGNQAITLFPTDQVLIGQVLSHRQGGIFHGAGMILNGQGLLFAGHSGAGKSTMVTLLESAGEILCDDRCIVRRHSTGWRVYGTWSHGDIPDVSPASAPLRAILLLEQANENELVAVEDRREIARRLPFLVIKPLVTTDWWEKTLEMISYIAQEVPVYRLRFQKNERVIDTIKPLIEAEP